MTTIYYTVEPGNTLWGIAQYFGTTVNDIARYNGIPVPDQIYPGQRLRIPTGLSKTPKWYSIRPGDTLFGIAQRYGITIEEILESNNIEDPNTIYPGQLIRLYV